MRVCDIICKKRNGAELSASEIKHLVEGYTRGEIPDYQISAFLMAVYFKGMTDVETSELTKAMTFSGEVLDLSDIKGVKIDKHSTGGVGDGISLVLAPLAACSGIIVPMMSGRGLGHTGGTLDKLESISGFNVNLSIKDFKRILGRIGVAMIGQTDKIAPADKKLYALRDVTATVDSIPLICASIMSKKMAEGTDGLLLDIKTGSGAFMKDIKSARLLAEKMVNIGKSNGKKMKALITNMDQPLGNAIGNSLEIKQALEVLNGTGPEDFTVLTIELASQMAIMAGIEKKSDIAKKRFKKYLEDGSALAKFKEMVLMQGGDVRAVDNPDKYLPVSKYKKDVFLTKAGYVSSIDTQKAGIASVILGAGRACKEDNIDSSAGIMIRKKPGDYVDKNEPVAVLHTNSEKNIGQAAALLKEAYGLELKKTGRQKLIFGQVN